ncbi:MAG: hypothetical protein WBY44_24710 [Bryobacteraceae bacterium]
MTAIPLGRITVPTAGTPVAITLTAAQKALLSAAGQCSKVEVWPDPAATGKVFVKKSGVVLDALAVPSGGYPVPWSTPDCTGNIIQPGIYSIDAATNGDGAYVTVWIR